jgi:hypothetical protein
MLFRGWDKSRPISELLDIERKLIERFKEASPYLLPSQPIDDWGWLSVGQHYGLPTRLLDWTANPLVGLFFAVQGNFSRDAVLWIYRVNPKDLRRPEKHSSPFAIEFTKVYQPQHHSLRVSLQLGWHTAHRFFGKDRNKIRSLETVKGHAKNLTKYVVPRSSCSRLCGELESFGISQATVFPDLSSLASNLRTRYVTWDVSDSPSSKPKL